MDKNILKLRKETGAGVMDCKRALKDADGDYDRAKEIIVEKGITKAGKKTERSTGSGVVEPYIHNGRIGVLAEIRCETDFVARTDEFKDLARSIAMQIASMNPKDVDELLKQPFIMDESKSVGDVITQAIATIGENIQVERFCRYEL